MYKRENAIYCINEIVKIAEKQGKKEKKPSYELQPINTVNQRRHQVIIKLVQTESTITDADQL